MPVNGLTNEIIGAAIEVHRTLGPGLFENTYEAALEYELDRAGLRVRRQPTLDVVYKDLRIENAYRLDLLVEDRVVVEVKSLIEIDRAHVKQVITYIRLGGWPIGLLLSFGRPTLRDGITRVVNDAPDLIQAPTS